ncbi:MAG: radical SAM protein [Methanomassiliicoccales archaeon]|nr:radical SAM protein [Methanomassiliicoccales archaeon]
MRISEVFHSLQGEGVLIGTPTVFVRTCGCNLECVWCDTVYAREEEGTEMSPSDVIEKVRGYGTPFVCLTGGEPLLQKDVFKLIDLLLKDSFHVSVETNGSLPLEDLPCSDNLLISMDIKCPSSGMSARMLMENLELLSPADQLKFVVADENDLLFAEEVLREHQVLCPVILTPVGGLDLHPVAEWALRKRLRVRVLPQLHKIIWGERRAV